MQTKNYIVNAFYLSWFDTKIRYKKSFLGPFWMTLGNLLGVVCLSMVWATLLNEDKQEFIPLLSIGLILWQFISGVLSESPRVLSENSATLRNMTVPIWFFPARLMGRNVINLAHNVVLIFCIYIYIGRSVSSIALLAVPAILLEIVILFNVAMILAGLGARFRDIRYAIEVMLPLIFFVSPIIFRPGSFGNEFIWYNPISYLVEVVRYPLMGQLPSNEIYLVFIFIFLASVIANILYVKFAKDKVIYWVN